MSRKRPGSVRDLEKEELRQYPLRMPKRIHEWLDHRSTDSINSQIVGFLEEAKEKEENGRVRAKNNRKGKKKT